MKKRSSLFLIIIVVAIGAFLFSLLSKGTHLPFSQHTQHVDTTPKETTLFFVGDMMFDRSVRSSVNKNFNGDYTRLFENLGEFQNADIVFANLEGPISDQGNNVGSIYSFRMDPKVADSIALSGIDIVSFANNHVGDWNVAAFTDTLARLSYAHISKTGAGSTYQEAEMPTIIEKNGVKFGFLGFSDVGPAWIKATDTSPGILLASDPRYSTIIENAKAKSDVLIVSLHFGNEYENVHNSRQETLAHNAIDSGADMVIGHHPHVMQDIETYNGKPIVYSLGNFIFDQYFSKDTMHGMLFEVTFTGNTLKSTNHRVIELNRQYQPTGIYEVTEEEGVSTLKQTTDSCPKPKKEYEDMSYLDVDQTVHLPDMSYIPFDLIKLDKSISKSSICLKEEAAIALKTMSDEAAKEKLSIIASSGFRDYATQKAILAQNIKDGNKNALVAVAKPGYSEHQLGLAVDLTSASIAYASAHKTFGQTTESTWLEIHAREYGFVQSYPEGKEEITGYMYEPWHYRYVGVENAKEIIEKGLTINQYFKQKKEEETAQ